MPLDNIFLSLATDADGLLVEGMTTGVIGAINYIRNPLRLAMGLYVVIQGFRMVGGACSARSLMMAVVRAVCVVTILDAGYYIPWVQQQLFDTIPAELARAMNGPRIDVNSAQQFDRLWEAVLHAASKILRKASGFLYIMDRGVTWFFAYFALGGILVMFSVWYLSRVLIAVLIIMGPFLIAFYLFGGTRQITNGWIGRVVGVMTWQLAAAVVLRLLLTAISTRMRILDASMDDMSLEELNGTFAGMCVIPWIGAVFMAVIPTAVAVGGGVGAANVAGAVGLVNLASRATNFVNSAGRVGRR